MASADFQWLSLREAALHRPDAYLGSNDAGNEKLPLLQPAGSLAETEVQLSPSFAKLFDEVLANALDAATRDHAVRSIRPQLALGGLQQDVAPSNRSVSACRIPLLPQGRSIRRRVNGSRS